MEMSRAGKKAISCSFQVRNANLDAGINMFTAWYKKIMWSYFPCVKTVLDPEKYALLGAKTLFAKLKPCKLHTHWPVSCDSNITFILKNNMTKTYKINYIFYSLWPQNE